MPRLRPVLLALVVLLTSCAPSLTAGRPQLISYARPTADGHEWAGLAAAVDARGWYEAAGRQAASGAWYAAAARQAAEAAVSAPTSRPAADPAPPAVTYDGDVAELIRSVFGFEGAVRVARCESTLNPSARNGPNFGLFQISDVHADQWATVIGRSFWSSWMDADANTRFAHWLWQQDGWGPWSCRWAA